MNFLILILLVFFVSCSSTRRVVQYDSLYIKTDSTRLKVTHSGIVDTIDTIRYYQSKVYVKYSPKFKSHFWYVMATVLVLGLVLIIKLK